MGFIKFHGVKDEDFDAGNIANEECKKLSREEKRKLRLEMGDGEVEMYRSYGVTKKVRGWQVLLNDLLVKIIFAAFCIATAILIAIGGTAWLTMGGLMFTTFFGLVFFTFLLIKSTRIPRARRKFFRKLKKICKQYKFRFTQVRSVWRGFGWDDDKGIDFILKAGHYTYYVKFATAYKSNSSFTFLSKTELKYTRYRLKNIFNLIFDRYDKSKMLKIVFPPSIDEHSKTDKRVIILNPVPKEIFAKNNMGVTVPTGSGDHSFGYYVFTGSSFINDVLRDNGK